MFEKYTFAAAIHFSCLKVVGESVQNPFLYYENNVAGRLNLIKTMELAGLRNLIFNSSATVYVMSESVSIREISTQNPYGASKLMVEGMLTNLAKACATWYIATLRYFNPIALMGLA